MRRRPRVNHDVMLFHSSRQGSSETLVIEKQQPSLAGSNPVGRDCEHNPPFASTSADECERLHLKASLPRLPECGKSSSGTRV